MLKVVLALLACSDPSGDSGLDLATSGTTDGGTWTVEYTTEPAPIPFDEDFTLSLIVTPPTELTVVADALMPEDDLRMDVDPQMASEAAGLWTASPMRFHVEGAWQIVVAVSTGADAERITFETDCCE